MMAPLRSKNGRDLLADTENLRNVLMSYKIQNSIYTLPIFKIFNENEPSLPLKKNAETVNNTVQQVRHWSQSSYRDKANITNLMSESQCGFRSHRDIVDIIVMIHEVKEKCCKQQQNLCQSFVNLTKPFYSVENNDQVGMLRSLFTYKGTCR